MLTLLKEIPLPILAALACLMLLAPFQPMPHVIEKLIMLKNGELRRPLDIFDLCFHVTPLALLALRWYLFTDQP